MHTFRDTREIFRQLSQIESPRAVQSVIENHEAWVQSEVVGEAVGRMLRGRPVDDVKIRRQRERLIGVITVLPRRVASAG